MHRQVMLLLTGFICLDKVNPDRLDDVKLGAELWRKQRITDIKKPFPRNVRHKGSGWRIEDIHRCMSAVDSESSS